MYLKKNYYGIYLCNDICIICVCYEIMIKDIKGLFLRLQLEFTTFYKEPSETQNFQNFKKILL